MTGELIGIFITSEEGGQPISVPNVDAIAGKGLRGDRYQMPEATPRKQLPDQQVTLIAIEAIQAANEKLQQAFPPEQFRRNLLTQNVDLNALVGQIFTIGSVQLRGVEPCDPCRRLEKFTCKGMIAALKKHGGLRCEILQSGTLHPGLPIQLTPTPEDAA
ncbi:MOSC domain-containing protein [Tuwongella immobilis]|uniref:MOSC domain-containing protein n=1 Tax=Tuwongella immobilis TaxID=692036 RepID=A0A6C2YW56_9BACT|nr:MOSC domain-containing protein [Tuwongella immobilis]VIP05393.1 mosc domain containing protein : Putative uncharacterized protein OS=uncultured gamma proteobacterium HF0200_40H22 PE=4 SV=1: MOSC [Tuwongella immobilis]VTS08142.1 mosc domain containing protein : Putative uncharacterized protein OS=uncultured gamma proteobacterium HF0200_40H22 PE=4 SV=1: MOSC [Tuwongella immobilis]